MLASMIMISLSMASASAEQALLRVDYESGEAGAAAAGVRTGQLRAPDAYQVDCTVARSGRCSLRTHIELTDDYISSGAHRAESDSAGAEQTFYSKGERYLYKFSLIVGSDWRPDSRSDIDLVWQFKRTASQPDMFIAIKGQQLVLRIVEREQVVLLPRLPLGVWLDLELTVLWSPANDGTVEATVKNVATGEAHSHVYRGRNMRDARKRAGYLKWGLYKPARIKEGADHHPMRSETVWHDDIAVYRLP